MDEQEDRWLAELRREGGLLNITPRRGEVGGPGDHNHTPGKFNDPAECQARRYRHRATATNLNRLCLQPEHAVISRAGSEDFEINCKLALDFAGQRLLLIGELRETY